MTRKILIISLCTALLCVAACRRLEQPSGTVTLSFSVGLPATRAASLGDGNPADGGGIYCLKTDDTVYPDLLIFIADESGAIIKYYDGLKDCNPAPLWKLLISDGSLLSNNYDGEKTSSTRLDVAFSFDRTGTYSVYAIANTRGVDAGMNIEIPNLSSVSTIADLDSKILSLTATAVEAKQTPKVGDRMPLTARGTLNVYKNNESYNGQVNLDMLRCFSKVQIIFNNHTGAEEALKLYHIQVKIFDINAKQGYMLEHSPDFVVPGSGSNYQDFTWESWTTSPASDPAFEIAKDAKEPVFATPPLFFPSIAPLKDKPSAGNRYLCNISFRVPTSGTYNPSNKNTYKEYSFTDLPIHDEMSQDIRALQRNQYLKIETIISATAVSFNFIVKDWIDKPEEVYFN